MYEMLMKEVRPARSSRLTVDPRALTPKKASRGEKGRSMGEGGREKWGQADWKGCQVKVLNKGGGGEREEILAMKGDNNDY